MVIDSRKVKNPVKDTDKDTRPAKNEPNPEGESNPEKADFPEPDNEE